MSETPALADWLTVRDQMPVFIFSLTYTRARGARRRALALWPNNGRRQPAMVRRATGSSPTDRQIPRTDTVPFLFFSLTYTRAREARAAALWLMAERWSPAPAMVQRATGSSPTDRQIPRTDTDPFLFFLSPTRAREERAATFWLMAEQWSPEPAMVRRATGSSPTDRKIPRTDTGGLTSLA